MNNLEDAYINIAKMENSNQVNFQQTEDGFNQKLARYKSVNLSPSFLNEAFGHYKRRLILFTRST